LAVCPERVEELLAKKQSQVSYPDPIGSYEVVLLRLNSYPIVSARARRGAGDELQRGGNGASGRREGDEEG
jgi:hypothetical protein